MNLLEPKPGSAPDPLPNREWIKFFIPVAGLFVLAGIAVVASIRLERVSAGRILAGVTIDGVDVGRLNAEQARTRLMAMHVKNIQSGLMFAYGEREVRLSAKEADELIRIRPDLAVNEALELGRTGRSLPDLWTRLRLHVHTEDIPLPLSIDGDGFALLIRSRLTDVYPFAENADLHVRIVRGSVTSTIQTEHEGTVIDFSSLARAIRSRLRRQDTSVIRLPVTHVYPSITKQDIEAQRERIPRILAHAPFKLAAEGQVWTVTSSTLAGWIGVATSTTGWEIDIDPERMATSVRNLAKNYIKTGQNGNLELNENNKVRTFVAPIEGIDVDVYATLASIQSGHESGSSTISITLTHVTPDILGDDAERLGIREALGVGRSNFSGSPPNRRKNIAHGANILNGILVAPDEEFSLLKTLGKVDGENGWLPELVIKENKTTPEFGGGLCQIGTTTFRAALASGLPITARQSHSYRVPYYEPAGTDATIYDPAPDFRFKNDTGAWILITTERRGDDLAFTFWGTKDGRAVTQTKPRIYNIVPPPEKKIVETLELAPGQTKCTERAHTGADASFDYKVAYADGQEKKVTFRSHYKPWGAVCLLGVARLSASSTGTGVDETGVNNPN